MSLECGASSVQDAIPSLPKDISLKALQAKKDNESLIITLVRHGETDDNLKRPRVFQGQGDTPLNETGKKQANVVAYRLSNVNYQHIFSSDLPKCRETALEIAKYHRKTTISFHKELREQNLGELTGAPWNVVKARIKESKRNLQQTIEALEGESNKDFVDRVAKFYGLLVKRFLVQPEIGKAVADVDEATLDRTNSDSNIVKKLAKDLGLAVKTEPEAQRRPGNLHNRSILVVTHGGWIQALITHLVTELGFPIETEPQPGFPKSTSIYRFVLYKNWLNDSQFKIPVEPIATAPSSFKSAKFSASLSSVSESATRSDNWEWAGKILQMNDVSHLASLSRKVRDPPKTPISANGLSATAVAASPVASVVSNASSKTKSQKKTFFEVVSSTIASGANLFSPSKAKLSSKEPTPDASPTRANYTHEEVRRTNRKSWSSNFGFSFSFVSSSNNPPRQVPYSILNKPIRKRLTRRQRRQQKRIDEESEASRRRKSLGW